jgi:hypothetical protein
MSNTTNPIPVNPGEVGDSNVVFHDPESKFGPPKGFVDIAITIPESSWEQLQQVATEEKVADDDIVAAALRDYNASRASNSVVQGRVKSPVNGGNLYPSQASPGPISVPVPAWIPRRFAEIAQVAGIELTDLIREEIGDLVRCQHGDTGLCGMVTDTEGNWTWQEGELQQCRKDFAAMCERLKSDPDGPECENPTMVSLVVIPAGKAAFFVSERTGRYLTACCASAGVDPDQYVDEWATLIVEEGLNGKLDVTKSGITNDVVESFPQDEERSQPEKDGLYEVMRGLAFEYQQELKQEAAASVERGGE